jgi:hypothetical protein
MFAGAHEGRVHVVLCERVHDLYTSSWDVRGRHVGVCHVRACYVRVRRVSGLSSGLRAAALVPPVKVLLLKRWKRAAYTRCRAKGFMIYTHDQESGGS